MLTLKEIPKERLKLFCNYIPPPWFLAPLFSYLKRVLGSLSCWNFIFVSKNVNFFCRRMWLVRLSLIIGTSPSPSHFFFLRFFYPLKIGWESLLFLFLYIYIYIYQIIIDNHHLSIRDPTKPKPS